MKAVSIIILTLVMASNISVSGGHTMQLYGIMNLDTTNSTITQMIQRAYGIVAGISALLIALLWIPIAIGYFSRDLDRKADAKERTKDALIGTIIFVMAVSGILYGVIHYIVVG